MGFLSEATEFLREGQELFGWAFQRQQPDVERPSFTPREEGDGALTVAPAGAYGTYLDLNGTVRTEAELITRYRDMTLQPECDAAIDEIVNESIAIDEEEPVKIVLDDLNQPAVVKKQIEAAFGNVLQLYNFKQTGYDLFKRWYIDGRLYFHVIIDPANPSEGIQELRYIDPRKIRKVREVVKKRVRGGADAVAGDAVITQVVNEYYIYTDKGFGITNKVSGPQSTSGLKIAKDAIIYVTSGITDALGSMVLSYLHKAIKPLNQLRMLEDASIIYRLSRAPERRVWYIDIGNLPKMKAEQYVRDIMIKHKNRLIYDSSTGNLVDDRKMMTMLEDYWLPQRDGKGTKVDTLPPGTNFNQIDDIFFFQKKLYNSLNVPVNRINAEDDAVEVVATAISRAEIKFGKFIKRLQTRFAHIFTKALERQLVLKKVMSLEDFNRISRNFLYEFAADNEFLEMKENQILTARTQLVMGMIPLIGRFYSNLWVRKNILHQTDEDIEEIDDEIAEETMDPQYNAGGEMGPGAQGMMVDTSAVQGGGAGGPAQAPGAQPNGKDQGPPPTPEEKQKKGAVKSTAKALSKGT